MAEELDPAAGVAVVGRDITIAGQSYTIVAPPNTKPSVAVTGVTALVRATASAMERRGLLYPAKDIRGWLLEADITHISNEVPFAADCPPPNPTQESMRFCSSDEYIQLLEDVGIGSAAKVMPIHAGRAVLNGIAASGAKA